MCCHISLGQEKIISFSGFSSQKSCMWAAFILFFGRTLASTMPVHSWPRAQSQCENDQSLSNLSQSIVFCSIAIGEAILRSQMTARDWQG